jgi:hypothetical protein
MRSAVHRVFRSKRGSMLVGYSSLILLVAIAAITLLGQTNAVGPKAPRGMGAVSST